MCATKRRLVQDKRTALHKAARFGRQSVVKVLLRNGADLTAKDVVGTHPQPSSLWQSSSLGEFSYCFVSSVWIQTQSVQYTSAEWLQVLEQSVCFLTLQGFFLTIFRQPKLLSLQTIFLATRRAGIFFRHGIGTFITQQGTEKRAYFRVWNGFYYL